MTTVDVGDVHTVAVTVRDDAGDPVDAGQVAATVTFPDSTQTSIPVLRTAVGRYQVGVRATVPGLHMVSFRASGLHESAVDDVFTARDPDHVRPLSLRQVKSWLGMETHTWDDALESLIDEVCDAGELYTGRVFGRRRVVVERQGDGLQYLTLPAQPALSVVSVAVDGETVTDWTLSADAAVIHRPSGWSGAVTIVYLAGYRIQPASDVTGARTLLKHIWREARGTVKPGAPLDDFLPFGIPNFVADYWDLGRRTGFA